MYLGTRLTADKRPHQRDKVPFYISGYVYPTLAAFIIGLLVPGPAFLIYSLLHALSVF